MNQEISRQNEDLVNTSLRINQSNANFIRENDRIRRSLGAFVLYLTRGYQGALEYFLDNVNVEFIADPASYSVVLRNTKNREEY